MTIPYPAPRLRALALGILIAISTPACHKPELSQHQESRPLMGTLVDIVTEGPDPLLLAGATDAAYAEMTRLSDMMNHYNPDSVVSAINRAAGIRPVAVPRELMQVLTRARMMSERTDGAFDITVGSLQGWRFSPDQAHMPDAAAIAALLPLVNYRDVVLDETKGTAFLRRKGMRIDLGGIAKLYILDVGIHVLKRNRVIHAMINGGGDVEVIGTIRGRPWRIGIRDPLHPERLYAAVELRRGFVVSSGDYERQFERGGRRYHHILDPKTGYPTRGPRAVTLISEDMDLVNGLSSSIMVMGMARGREIIERNPAMEGIIFDRDGSAWVSPVLERRLIRPAGNAAP
jgi:thiamine biosynthesis lipoprotein